MNLIRASLVAIADVRQMTLAQPCFVVKTQAGCPCELSIPGLKAEAFRAGQVNRTLNRALVDHWSKGCTKAVNCGSSWWWEK